MQVNNNYSLSAALDNHKIKAITPILTYASVEKGNPLCRLLAHWVKQNGQISGSLFQIMQPNNTFSFQLIISGLI